MIKYKKDTIASLTELFQAWMGGKPENDNEVRAFLKSSKLDKILGVNDVDVILRDQAYFPDEVLPAIYSALPLKLKLAQKEVVISARELCKLNSNVYQNIARAGCLSISFGAAIELREECEPKKQFYINELILKKKLEEKAVQDELLVQKREQKKAERKEFVEQLKAQKMAEIQEEEKKRERQKRLDRLREKQESILLKKQKEDLLRQEVESFSVLQVEELSLDVLKYKKRKEKELDKLSEWIAGEEIKLRKAFNNIRNEVYREKHRFDIRGRANQGRLAEKEHNLEALQAKDKENNSNVDRKKICRTYYERNKEKICKQTNANPKAAYYKKQYKVKKRFEQTTGPKILALLNGIINQKSD